MLSGEDPYRSPPIQKGQSQKQQSATKLGGNGGENGGLFTPRFKSVAEMAGWDEESLLIASLVVEDTPERESKHKKRSDLLNVSTPPSNSRRKRRVPRKSPVSIPVATLDLDEVEVSKEVSDVQKQKMEIIDVESDKEKKLKKVIKDDSNGKGGLLEDSSSPAIPCIDRLREELSCAICLEICYEPSTTPCGHSFCKKCLRSAADRCGKKCPKCRNLISNGRSCTINTVLWNTIQLLFPQEIEARKAASTAAEAAGTLNKRDTSRKTSPRVSHYNARNGTILALNSPESEERRAERRRDFRSTRSRTLQPSTAAISNNAGISNATIRRRDLVPGQDGDSALALRLQREEFMEAFRGRGEGSPLAFARANLRAMASRAMATRTRRSRESR